MAANLRLLEGSLQSILQPMENRAQIHLYAYGLQNAPVDAGVPLG